MNVLGPDGNFRNDSTFFNPTGSSPPFFQIFDDSFLSILGSNPSIRVIAENDTFAFAHEAPVWIPETDEVFFASIDGGVPGISDINHNNRVSKISVKNARSGGNVTVTPVRTSYLSHVRSLTSIFR